MVTFLVCSFHVLIRRTAVSTSYIALRTLANHRSKLPPNWKKNKLKKSKFSVINNMDVAEIEKLLLPLRLAVKEQVSFLLIMKFYCKIYAYRFLK